MQQMAGVEYTENVTEDQLEAMAGGEAIRYQATAFGLTKNNKVQNRCHMFCSWVTHLNFCVFHLSQPCKMLNFLVGQTLIKSTNRLRDSLLGKDEPKLAVPLLLLIAQQRSQ